MLTLYIAAITDTPTLYAIERLPFYESDTISQEQVHHLLDTLFQNLNSPVKMPCSLHHSSFDLLKEDGSWPLQPKHYPVSIYLPLPLLPLSAFFATISVIIRRTAQNTNALIATRWPQDIHHICACGPSAPFVSVGAIPTKHAHNDFVEIVINQATFQMTVCFQTRPRTKPLISTEMEHLCDKLRRESIVLVPGARVYERGNVTVSYLDSHSFLICISHCHFLPLGLTTFTEDRYTFTLGPIPSLSHPSLRVPLPPFPFCSSHPDWGRLL